MVSAFFTLFAAALVLLCAWMYIRYTYWKRRGIPSVKGYYPLIGHLLPVITLRESIAELLQRIHIEHNGCSMVGIYKALKPALIVREPGLIKTVLQNNFSNFHENGLKVIPEIDPLLAKNPFFTDGELWTVGRKRLTHAFSNVRLKILFASISGVCKKFENFLDRRLQSKSKHEIELKYLFQKFTGEVVANAGFGIEGFCFEDKVHPNAFDQVARSLFQPTLLEGLLGTFTLFLSDVNRLFKVRFVSKELDRFFRMVVAENLEIRRKEETPRNDFLQLMIDIEKSRGKLDESVIAAHAFSFYFDGYETTSITMSFVGYQLAVHQDVQEKLRNEVKTVIEKHGGELTYEALKEMSYMDMVISESQRHYTGLAFMTKICTESFELQGSDGISCRVEPDTEILISLHGIQMDPKYWTDPEVFDPERFNEERRKSIEKMTFFPFGDGPRVCVGMRMAMLQMKTCLATLLRNYKIELSSKTQLPLKLSPHYFLTAPVGGLWVHVSKL